MDASAFERAIHHHKRGELAYAETLYRDALARNPRHPDALQLLGLVAIQTGRLQAGVELLGQSIQLNPNQPGVHMNLGNALTQLGRIEDALRNYEQVLAMAPGHVGAWNNRGNLLQSLERPLEAVASYDRALKLAPPSAHLYLNRGNALRAARRFADALLDYDRTLALDPLDSGAHYLRAKCLRELRLFEEALNACDRALQIRSDFSDALNDRGIVLRKLHRPREAVDSFERALALEPGFAEAHSNLGGALADLKRPMEALASYARALELQPMSAEIWNNQGLAFQDLSRHPEAAQSFERAYAISTSCPYALGLALDSSLQTCEWSRFDSMRSHVLEMLSAGSRIVPPFALLAMTDSAATQCQGARIYVADQYPEICERPAIRPHERIRIAYVSGDLREHALCYLMAGVFEAHARERFETTAISLHAPEVSPMAHRVRSTFDRFIDGAQLSDQQLVEQMRAHEIDIAVDLMGFTRGSRPGIFGRRAAPVQVNYLGYPGTTGAGYIDYILADEFVIPRESRSHYVETVVYLPHCFQANDGKRWHGTATPRAQLGLPEQAFVFCSFNNAYKISPTMFDLWCRLLLQTEGSVLWLTAAGPVSAANLRREAKRRGVDADRLIMAERLPYEQHLRRLPAADLFLDSLPFNAGTTASDALWMGLPLLTCAGEAFAARMAGSLLRAMGLTELIAGSLDEYEQLALKLASNPGCLKDIREKLMVTRTSAPLFQTARFCQHLEAAYTQMWQRAVAGEPPTSFSIDP